MVTGRIMIFELNAALIGRKIATEEWEKKVLSLIESRRKLRIPWGWKDPRTCHLLGRYLEFLDAPKFIRCVRSPGEIEASMVRAYSYCGWTQQAARAVRLRREEELDAYLPWHQTLTIDFNDLRRHRETTVRLMIAFCGLAHATKAQFRVAVNFVRPSAATFAAPLPPLRQAPRRSRVGQSDSRSKCPDSGCGTLHWESPATGLV
jgi:hypothetical protein